MLEIVDLSTDLIGPIDISIPGGECIAVLGPSGSGKSLLLRAIADLDPNKGDVHLNGHNRDQMLAYEWRRLVALVPAESGWWADRVRDHFAPAPDPTELLEAIDLPQAFDWEVSRLSTGERHRLAIVRALQGEPQALLLDEPTASLDPEATQMIENLLKQQCARDVSILMVTHDRKQANRLATRSMLMDNKRLVHMTEVEP